MENLQKPRFRLKLQLAMLICRMKFPKLLVLQSLRICAKVQIADGNRTPRAAQFANATPAQLRKWRRNSPEAHLLFSQELTIRTVQSAMSRSQGRGNVMRMQIVISIRTDPVANATREVMGTAKNVWLQVKFCFWVEFWLLSSIFNPHQLFFSSAHPLKYFFGF